jgi:hypothetical protein
LSTCYFPQELNKVQDEKQLEIDEDLVVRKMKRADFLDNPEAKSSWGDSKPLMIRQSKRMKQEIKRDPDGEDDSIPVINLDVTEPTSANSILNGAHEEMFLLQVHCLLF